MSVWSGGAGARQSNNWPQLKDMVWEELDEEDDPDGPLEAADFPHQSKKKKTHDDDSPAESDSVIRKRDDTFDGEGMKLDGPLLERQMAFDSLHRQHSPLCEPLDSSLTSLDDLGLLPSVLPVNEFVSRRETDAGSVVNYGNSGTFEETEDPTVVTASCHFSLNDVGPAAGDVADVEFFEGDDEDVTGNNLLELGWDTINQVDMDNMFRAGNQPLFEESSHDTGTMVPRSKQWPEESAPQSSQNLQSASVKQLDNPLDRDVLGLEPYSPKLERDPYESKIIAADAAPQQQAQGWRSSQHLVTNRRDAMAHQHANMQATHQINTDYYQNLRQQTDMRLQQQTFQSQVSHMPSAQGGGYPPPAASVTMGVHGPQNSAANLALQPPVLPGSHPRPMHPMPPAMPPHPGHLLQRPMSRQQPYLPAGYMQQTGELPGVPCRVLVTPQAPHNAMMSQGMYMQYPQISMGQPMQMMHSMPPPPVVGQQQQQQQQQQNKKLVYHPHPSPSLAKHSSKPPYEEHAMTPQEKIEKLRWRQQMRLAAEQRQRMRSHQASDQLQQGQVAAAVLANSQPTPAPHVTRDTDGLLADDDPDVAASMSCAEESSVEAAVLHQLTTTMVRLDVNTRLCIRDAMYRLARSALHRKALSEGTASGAVGEPAMAGPANASPGTAPTMSRLPLEVLETETNPIDRNIANLLFQRPNPAPVTAQPLSAAQTSDPIAQKGAPDQDPWTWRGPPEPTATWAAAAAPVPALPTASGSAIAPVSAASYPACGIVHMPLPVDPHLIPHGPELASCLGGAELPEEICAVTSPGGSGSLATKASRKAPALQPSLTKTDDRTVVFKQTKSLGSSTVRGRASSPPARAAVTADRGEEAMRPVSNAPKTKHTRGAAATEATGADSSQVTDEGPVHFPTPSENADTVSTSRGKPARAGLARAGPARPGGKAIHSSGAALTSVGV